MIVIKLMDSLLIIGICTYLGISKAQKFTFRIDKLRNLKRSFCMFKSKLEFTYEPIKMLFEEISETIYSNEKNIFLSYIENMKNGNFDNAWDLAVAENSDFFTKEDIKLITGFGKLLGKTDMNGQISEVELATEFLEKQIIDAEENRRKNDKLYKSLGAIAGITLVIILI